MRLECVQETALPPAIGGIVPACEPAQQEAAASRWGRGTLRWFGAVAALPCLAVLVVGAVLTPRAAGHGTHEELGLPPCAMLANTGWPCPSCGLTTSVSAAVHGQFAAAARAQPFGILLTAGAAVLAAAGSVQVLTGRNMLARVRLGVIWALVAVLGLLAGWAWSVLAGMASGRFPMR
ncbi:MAG: DUF2752 domain-containing protein [Phycisphaerae bacterium]